MAIQQFLRVNIIGPTVSLYLKSFLCGVNSAPLTLYSVMRTECRHYKL